MPVAEAAALARRGSHAQKGAIELPHLEPHDPQADRLALEKLVAWCHQYSPLVGLEDVDAPETLLLDVTGIGSLFGGEPMLLQQTARGLRRLRLRPRLALADTIGAAWAVAHYGCHNQAADQASVVESGESYAAIQPLPLAALRLPSATLETLDRLGLQRIDELLTIPRVELHARFGTLLLKRLDQALGTAAEAMCAVQPLSDFTAAWLLEYPTDRQDTIERVIEQLVERLIQRLANNGEGALRLVCQLDCHPAPPIRVEVGLFQPSASTQHLLKLTGIQMERLKLTGPVNAVLVRVTEHARLERRQQWLFDQGQRRSDSPHIASLIDRLASRLGHDAVVGCVLKSDAQPEMAYREEPLVDRSLQRKRLRSTSLSFAPLDRPLHLLRRPIRLQVFAVAAEMPGRVPFRFCYDGHDYNLARYWGPERIETGWWRRRGVQRDYYRVETKSGHRFWLFQQISSGSWFLQGIFS